MPPAYKSRYPRGRHRGCCPSVPAKADDGLRRSRQLDSDPLGEWHRLRRDEADCRSHGRRNDYIHDSRIDFGSGFLRADEGTSTATWHVAAGTGGVKEVKECDKSSTTSTKPKKGNTNEDRTNRREHHCVSHIFHHAHGRPKCKCWRAHLGRASQLRLLQRQRRDRNCQRLQMWRSPHGKGQERG